MKKYFMYSVLCLSMMAGTALFSSCSDDDVEDKPAPGSPEYIAQSKATEKAQALYRVLGTLAPADSLPDNWETATYEPMIGDALDGANPYVRTLAVSGMDEAVAIYNAMTGRELKADAQSDTWSYEGLGSLSFQAAGTAELTANIQCALSQMPHLTTLRLVPASALGENAGFVPYYHTGDVIQTSDGSFWICARSANSDEDLKDSHWFSFQLSEKDNYKTFEKTTKREKTTVPTNLGCNEVKMKYLMQLLSLMADPSIYSDMIQHEMRNGLGDLKDAYKEQDIKLMASAWDAYVWNRTGQKVLPVGKDYFKGTGEITLLYNGYTSPLFSSNMTLYTARYDGRGHSNATLSEYKWNMNEGRFFDVHNLVNTGKRGNNEVGPDEALVVRYKTASQLAGNRFSRLDPTLPIPGATFVCRPYQPFRTGDIIRNDQLNVTFFCVYPSFEQVQSSSVMTDPLFVSCDPMALSQKEEDNWKVRTEYLWEFEAVPLMYVFNTLLKFPSKYAKTVSFIAEQTGLNLKNLFDNRVVDGKKCPCSSILYKSDGPGHTISLNVCRAIFVPEYNDERDGFKIYYYQNYLAPDGKATKDKLCIEDASRQDVIDMYAKDRWSAFPFEDKTLASYMTKADASYDLNSYAKAMKDSQTRKTNIFNERVIMLKEYLYDPIGLLGHDGWTLVRNTDPYWTDDNVTEIIDRWVRERGNENCVLMDDEEYIGL